MGQPALRDLVHDDDRQNQDALQDDDEFTRQPAWSCTAVSPRDEIDHTIAATTIPIGLLRARNATAMPGESEQRLVVPHENPALNQQLLHADQAGEHADDQEHLDLHGADPDAARLRRARRGADRASLVPESHAPDQEPHTPLQRRARAGTATTVARTRCRGIHRAADERALLGDVAPQIDVGARAVSSASAGR